MHFTVILYLLIATLSSASQQPLERIAHLPPESCSQSVFSPGYGRCFPYYHWCCALYRHKLYCGCCRNRKHGHESATVGLSHADVTARTLAEIQSVTTLEVLTEVQPGNNDTLISLFEVQCYKRQHIACTQTDCGFLCGCYDNWNFSDIGTHEYGGVVFDDYRESNDVQKGDAEPDTREVPGRKFNEELSEIDDSDVEFDQQRGYSDFSFQTFYPGTCPPDLFWQCCPVGCRRSVCHCTDVGLCE